MKIAKLEISGFKSFNRPVSICFDQGITGIVGPNGCGKSNIIDAVLWVTGSAMASQLRGDQMEDIIFAGTEQRPPASFAEVSLTLEKTENGEWPEDFQSLSELVISRKLKRGGESQYSLNGSACFLRNIQQLLNDIGAMGFSIIEQDNISNMVSYKPEYKRELIDQAAGTLQFRHKKRLAQNKLKNTCQNILRVEDVLSEQKKQLKRLEKQAHQAQMYKELKEKLSLKETYLLKKKYFEIGRKIHNQKQSIQNILTKEEESQKSLQSLKTQCQKAQENFEGAYSQLESQREGLLKEQKELNQCEMEVQRLKISIDSESGYIHQLEGEISEFKKYQVKKEKEINALQNQIQKDQQQLSSLEKDLSGRQGFLESAQLKLNLIEKEKTEQAVIIEKTTREEVKTQEALNNLEKDQIRMQKMIQENQEEIKKKSNRQTLLKKSCIQLKTRLDNFNQLHLDLKEEIRSQRENILRLESLKTEKDKELENISISLIQKESKKKSLQSLKEQIGFSVSGYEWVKKEKSLTTLQTALDIESGFETAVRSVLAQRIHSFIVENDQSVLNILDNIHEKSLSCVYMLSYSRNTQLPVLEKLSSLKKEKGVMGFLRNHVQIKPSLKNRPGFSETLLDFLFYNVVLVDSLKDKSLLFKKYPMAVFVSQKEGFVYSQCSFSGGHSDFQTLDFFKENSDLENQMKLIAQDKKVLEKDIAQQAQNLKKMRLGLDQLNHKYSSHCQSIEGYKKELEFLQKELNMLEEDSQSAYKKFKNDELEWEGFTKTLNCKRTVYQEIQKKLEGAKQKLRQIDQNLQKALENRNKAKEAVGVVQFQQLSLKKDTAHRQSRVQMMKQSIEEMSQKEKEFLRKTDHNQSTVQKNEGALVQKQTELEQKKENFMKQQAGQKSLEDSYQEQLSYYKSLEKQIADLSQSESCISEEKHRLEVKLEACLVERKNLEEKAFDLYQLELKSLKESKIEDDHLSQEEVSQLKEQLSRIGQVNLLALSEYEELSQENQNLRKQYEDLIQSKQDLEKVIDEMDQISEKRFKKTFEEVNMRLGQVFTSVFNGGKAQLALVDMPNGLKGVEILACPPGKKLKSLKLLSGGEKSLTALSMLLALFLVRPAPFCILDEVDAALDDQNVTRFNSLLLEIARKCQVILVTHNKYSMKECHRLYGVTMEEKGVTQLLSVNMQEALL